MKMTDLSPLSLTWRWWDTAHWRQMVRQAWLEDQRRVLPGGKSTLGLNFPICEMEQIHPASQSTCKDQNQSPHPGLASPVTSPPASQTSIPGLLFIHSALSTCSCSSVFLVNLSPGTNMLPPSSPPSLYWNVTFSQGLTWLLHLKLQDELGE